MNDYGQTDKVIDIYDEIERAYLGLWSVFDDISPDDLIFAFFPCTEFEDQKNMCMLGNQKQQQGWSDTKKLNYNLYLHKKLTNNYELITKMVIVCINKNIPLVIENPAGNCHYLTRNWSIKPKIVDRDRRENGDYYTKPTQYWFINCDPKNNVLFEPIEWVDKKSIVDTHDTAERSEIHPQYAERFIKMYIADYVDGNYEV